MRCVACWLWLVVTIRMERLQILDIFFMWVWGFLRHNKIGVEAVCVFGLGCAAYVDGVW